MGTEQTAVIPTVTLAHPAVQPSATVALVAAVGGPVLAKRDRNWVPDDPHLKNMQQLTRCLQLAKGAGVSEHDLHEEVRRAAPRAEAQIRPAAARGSRWA